ncbi:MAG: 1-acyl-sn-glycerol-3-phosphate acyltransferase [Clostridia bacterium]|nr:1-acyl-sn-glycerol-3-phosphate acyltransferase [Clostridia bacterium]
MPEISTVKHERVIYYSDPLNDDFAGTDINTCEIKPDFRYVRRSPVWRLLSFLAYYALAVPIVWTVSKIWLGLRFENRSSIRKLRGKGFFLYGNHTQRLDAFVPSLAAFPVRAYIVAGPDAVSIPGIKNLVMMLGALPIPSSPSVLRRFIESVGIRISEKSCVAVFPEAHIWPFYTGIRPFPDTSFRYPVLTGAPCVAMVTTYRRRRGLFSLFGRPGMTVTFSEIFEPDPVLPPRQAQAELRRQAFEFMDGTSRGRKQICYYRYVRRQPDDPDR